MLTTGLERFFEIFNHNEDFKQKNFAILCNHAAIDKNYNTLWDKMIQKGYNLKTIFGPQHGLFPITQDNMIEWEGDEKVRQVKVFSLYGKHRIPTDEMLEDIDIIIIDLPDIGTRYYTFAWSLLLMMEKASDIGKRILILDRPNPLNGEKIEGPILDMEYNSFVGLAPIPVRHGMTLGELALFFRDYFKMQLDLEIIKLKNWNRKNYFNETELPWVLPSPNMPSLETAIVYPGMCLLEGTNLSEGRGTTRPFTIFGAPYINQDEFLEEINKLNLKGFILRKHKFMPTFQKYVNETCNGFEIHITDRNEFNPFLLGCAIIKTAQSLYPTEFAWKEPPYEYEYKKLPIDILLGGKKYREALINDSFENFIEICREDESFFANMRKEYLLYD